MNDRLPRKLAAILYADVAEYSRLTGEDEDSTHQALSEYLDLMSSNIESLGGQVVHYAGDAVLARFDAVVDALSSAVAIQNEIYKRNKDVPDERKVQFRIGVNLGDVIEDRGDIYGDGVNVAARLESLARPGGICISESVRVALGNIIPLEFEDMGEQSVKNIDEPVRAYQIKGMGTGIATISANNTRQSKSGDKPSVAVLQFQNMSKDADDDYFVEGITEEIMTRLCRYRQIVVTHISSSNLVSKQGVEVGEATKRLGVQYALTGSVRKAGDRVRIIASLIEGETGQQLWSEQYDHVLEDIFQVQDEVAQKIVTMLVGKIERSDHERSLSKDTDNLSAYECVLHGRHFFHDWKGSEDDVLRAREIFERAIEIDPRYAAAFSGLGATYISEFGDGWSNDPEATGIRALEFAHKAIELDEHDSYAHLVLSFAYWHVKSDFELAKSQIEAAIELNPNYYWNYCYGCWFSACYGDLETSVFQAKEAIRRNPLLPNGCLHSLGIAEYLSEHYEDAITTFCQISKLEPGSYACLAACYAQLGRIEEATKIANECVEHSGECAMSTEEWHKFWGAQLKFKEQAPIDHLIEGLDKAGLVRH
jgi:adenylate cyclase